MDCLLGIITFTLHKFVQQPNMELTINVNIGPMLGQQLSHNCSRICGPRLQATTGTADKTMQG